MNKPFDGTMVSWNPIILAAKMPNQLFPKLPARPGGFIAYLGGNGVKNHRWMDSEDRVNGMRINPKIDVNHPPILKDLGCALETNRGLNTHTTGHECLL